MPRIPKNGDVTPSSHGILRRIDKRLCTSQAKYVIRETNAVGIDVVIVSWWSVPRGPTNSRRSAHDGEIISNRAGSTSFYLFHEWNRSHARSQSLMNSSRLARCVSGVSCPPVNGSLRCDGRPLPSGGLPPSS